jgi:hypothetical protein
MGIICPGFPPLIFLGPMSVRIDLNSFERARISTFGAEFANAQPIEDASTFIIGAKSRMSQTCLAPLGSVI